MKTTKKIITSLVTGLLLLAECSVCNQPITTLAASAPTTAKSLTIVEGKKKTINLRGAYIKSKQFKSSKKEIATVSKKGVVTAKKAGNCNITVTVKYLKAKNSKKILAKKLICNVTVKRAQATWPVTGWNKNENEVNALKKIIAEQKTLGASVSEDLDSTEYDWSPDGKLTMINWDKKNLQGSLSLQDLPWLKYLYCNSNQLTGLNVSGNTVLTTLSCNGNQLTNLNVSGDTALTGLYCGSNRLTNLDVRSNTALTALSCEGNQLTSLDVSNNTALTELLCGANQLTSLDVRSNTALITLDCSSNQLTNLDVSNCTGLKVLWKDEDVNVTGKP